MTPSSRSSITLLVCLAAGACSSAYSATAITPQSLAPTLSSEITDAFVVSQLSVGASTDIQVRNVSSGTDIRSAAQSFTWQGTDALSGLGLMVGDGKTWGTTTTQSFELSIYSASGLAGSVGDELATYTFTMTSSLAVAGNWLYFDLPEPIALSNNSVYFFQLKATSLIQNVSGGFDNIFVLERSGTDLYSLGRAAQLTSNDSALPTGQSWDYTFFVAGTSQIPEPSTAAALSGLLVLCGAICFRRQRRS